MFQKEKFVTVGIKVVAPFGELHKEVPGAWKRLGNRLNEITDRKSDIMTEIAMKVEESVYTELIGVKAEAESAVPEGMSKVHIPGQLYIYHHHTDSLQEITRSFEKMYDGTEGKGLNAGDFKIDIGYRRAGCLRPHDLCVKMMA